MNKCPICGATMCPLAWSSYCPNNCDKMIYFTTGSGMWRIDRIKPQDKIPTWATRGWFLDNIESIGKRSSDLTALAEAWRISMTSEGKMPWLLKDKSATSSEINAGSSDMLVFGLVKPN